MSRSNIRVRERAPTQVLALVRQERDQRRILAAFGETCAFVSSVGHLRAGPSLDDVVLAIAAADAAEVESLCDATRELVRQSVFVAVLVSPTAHDMHVVVECTRAGASSVIVRDVDDYGMGLRRLLDISPFIHMPARILESLSDELCEPTRSLVADCLAHSHQRERAQNVSRRLGISERTATNWARAGGFRGVREVLSLSRMTVALGLIESTSLSVSVVADRLNFGSASHLANTMRRCSGHSIRRALELGDHVFWARRLLLGHSTVNARTTHG